MPRAACALAILIASASAAVDARADEPSAAAKLFDQGLAAMRAGRHSEACPALLQSYELEPLAGVLFTVAECESSWGKISTALRHYDDFLKLLVTLPAEQAAKHKERRQVALEKVAGLARMVPHLTISVPADAPKELVIKRNGEPIAPSSWGVAVGVDPGDYELTAELPSGQVWSRTIKLGQGESARADVTLPAPKKNDSSTEQTVAGATDQKPDRTWAWVGAGVGATSLAVGAVAGVLVLSKKGTIDSECVEKLCTPEGKDAADSAQTWGMVSTIGIGVGVAAGVVSTVLFLSSGSSKKETQRTGWAPWAAPQAHGAAIGLEGRF